MVEKIQGLPWWFPLWLYRAIKTAWWCSIMMGLVGYFTLSMINDMLGTIPYWAIVVAGVGSGMMVRLGIALEWRKRLRGTDQSADNIFDTLVVHGVPAVIAAHAEVASERPPSPEMTIRTLISTIFWLVVIIFIQVGVIIALLIWY